MWIDVVEVEHGEDSTDCQPIGDDWQLKKMNSQKWKWILRYDRQKSRSLLSGSADAETYYDKEGNRSYNGSQEWLGTR